MGIAITQPIDGEDPADALRWPVDRADAAMYDAKQHGPDQVAARWVPPRPPRPDGEAAPPDPASLGVA